LICKPYKNAQLNHVSQGFHDNHKAVDFAFKYRTYLVAPESCWVDRVITAETIDEGEELSRGYGIVLKSFFNNSSTISLIFFCIVFSSPCL